MDATTFQQAVDSPFNVQRVYLRWDRGEKNAEIAFATGLPMAVVDVIVDRIRSRPMFGDPTPGEIADRAYGIKAANLDAMQAGAEERVCGSRLVRGISRVSRADHHRQAARL